MIKVAPIAIAAILVATLCGCSGSAQPQQQTPSKPEASQTSEKLTDQEKSQIAEYAQSPEFSGLVSAIDDTIARFSDAAETMDADTFDELFLNLTQALQNMDNLDVSPVCEKIDYNYRQATRSLLVAVGDYSSYLHGDGGQSKIDEANEYLGMANQFINDAATEMERLLELAQ